MATTIRSIDTWQDSHLPVSCQSEQPLDSQDMSGPSAEGKSFQTKPEQIKLTPTQKQSHQNKTNQNKLAPRSRGRRRGSRDGSPRLSAVTLGTASDPSRPKSAPLQTVTSQIRYRFRHVTSQISTASHRTRSRFSVRLSRHLHTVCELRVTEAERGPGSRSKRRG